MNWGYRILTVYLLFVGGIVTLAVLSFQQTLDLETEDYYEAEKLQDSKMEQRKLGQTYKHLIKINQLWLDGVINVITDIRKAIS